MDKTPRLINEVTDSENLLKLQNYFKENYKNYYYETKHGRYLSDSNADPVLKEFLYSNLELVRNKLNNDKILPTVAFFAHYEGKASLSKHKDSYGGTHTLDFALYQTEPWDIYIEGVPYTLKENQGLAFWGEEQFHWRHPITNPKAQVAVIFCHYAEPDHYRFKQEDLNK